MRVMSQVRMRVAINDWWASRKVVSVSSRRFCLRVHFGTLVRWDFRFADSSRRNAARHLRIAVDQNLAHVGEHARGTVLLGLETEKVGRCLNEACGHLTGSKGRMQYDVFEEGDVRLDAADPELAQASIHALAGLLHVIAARRDLYQERIVIGRDDRSAISGSPVEADPEPRGRTIGLKLAVVGEEAVGRVFGGHPALQGRAPDLDVLLRRNRHFLTVQIEALRDLNLSADDVDAGDLFGNRMLDLNAWIDLDEEPLARIDVDQEFHGPRAHIPGRAGQR